MKRLAKENTRQLLTQQRLRASFVLMLGGLLAVSSACDSETSGTSSPASSSSSSSSGPGGGEGGAGAGGGTGGAQGGNGGTGMGGDGGDGGGCSEQAPNAALTFCGGTSSVGAGGAGTTECVTSYCDSLNNEYAATCSTNTSGTTCSCTYNSTELCSCTSQSTTCENCCPGPWQGLGGTGGAGGFAGAGGSGGAGGAGGGGSSVAVGAGGT